MRRPGRGRSLVGDLAVAANLDLEKAHADADDRQLVHPELWDDDGVAVDAAPEPGDKVLRVPDGRLVQAVRRDEEVSSEANTGIADRAGGLEGCRQRALHVGRATAVKDAALQLRGDMIERHRVDVRVQLEARTTASPAQPRHDRGGGRVVVELLNLEARRARLGDEALGGRARLAGVTAYGTEHQAELAESVRIDGV